MPKTYCIAKCANTKCTESKYFMPRYWEGPAVDFSDRCKEHKPVKK